MTDSHYYWSLKMSMWMVGVGLVTSFLAHTIWPFVISLVAVYCTHNYLNRVEAAEKKYTNGKKDV